MTPKCHKHPHSSEESAMKCFYKNMASRVKRMEKQSPEPIMPKYVQEVWNPPLEIKKGSIKVLVFASGRKIN